MRPIPPYPPPDEEAEKNFLEYWDALSQEEDMEGHPPKKSMVQKYVPMLEELKKALKLCIEQMCRRSRESAKAKNMSQECMEGCETLRLSKGIFERCEEKGE